jgi:hypothetical protein
LTTDILSIILHVLLNYIAFINTKLSFPSPLTPTDTLLLFPSPVYHNDLYSFDPTSSTWNLLSAASAYYPPVRASHGFTSIAGKLYVHGGYVNGTTSGAGVFVRAYMLFWDYGWEWGLWRHTYYEANQLKHLGICWCT